MDWYQLPNTPKKKRLKADQLTAGGFNLTHGNKSQHFYWK
jgi:hypothetical protein